MEDERAINLLLAECNVRPEVCHVTDGLDPSNHRNDLWDHARCDPASIKEPAQILKDSFDVLENARSSSGRSAGAVGVLPGRLHGQEHI